MTRRVFLRGMVGVAGTAAAAGLLAACGGAATATTGSVSTGAATASAAPAVTSSAAATTAAATTSAASATSSAASTTTAGAAAASTAASTSAAASAAATNVTATASALSQTKYPLKSTKITAWAWQSFTPAADRFITNQAQDWGKANGGNVEYDIVQNSVFNQKLAAAIEAKTVPDVIMLSNVLYYQSLNLLADMTSLYNKLNGMAGGFYKSFLPGIQVNNKIYSIPIESGPSPLFVRLDLMEQATGQRAAPKTLDDMEAAGKKINKPTSLYAIGWTLGRTPDCEGNVTDIIHNDGGAFVDKGGTKPAIQSDGTMAALTRIKRWWDEKLIPPDSTSWDDTGNNSAYQAKRVAFADNPASIYSWLVANDQQLLGNTAMAPIPAGKAGSFGGGAGGWSWSVSNASKNLDGSMALVEFLMQPDNLETQCEVIGGRWYPSYVDLAKRPFWTSKPQFAGFPDLINNAVYNSYPAPPLPNLMSALGEVDTGLVIADMAQAVIVKNTSIDQAMSDAQKKMEAIFTKYKLG